MKSRLLFLFLLLLLTACSSTDSQKKQRIIETKDENAFNILVGQFAHNIETIWGRNEILIAGSKDYVKYMDDYQTRSHINFDRGMITIETIATEEPELYLRQAIVHTLLMNDNPELVNLYTNEDIAISEEPFLYRQVVDNENQPIRWPWRASRFADYLLASQLKSRQSGIHTIWYVEIRLVANHVAQRAYKYLNYVRQSSQRYHVDEQLVLAIIQTESNFNPYAVSNSDALGLMQIVRHTAGYDVFKFLGYSGKPSRSYLLDPVNNIDIGTAYLAILRDNYLKGIRNPVSQRYAVISAYNSGAGSVLRTFSNDRERAIAIINNMTPEELYHQLTTNHSSAEARRYLYKVESIYRYNRGLK